MAKSYVPRMLLLAKALNVYITKHQSTIFKYVTDQPTQAAITNCNSCLNSLLALLPPTREQP